MINVSEEVRRDIQTDMFASPSKSDTQLVDNKHSVNYSKSYEYVNMIVNLVSTHHIKSLKIVLL